MFPAYARFMPDIGYQDGKGKTDILCLSCRCVIQVSYIGFTQKFFEVFFGSKSYHMERKVSMQVAQAARNRISYTGSGVRRDIS